MCDFQRMRTGWVTTVKCVYENSKARRALLLWGHILLGTAKIEFFDIWRF
jgi:hypothetical protein